MNGATRSAAEQKEEPTASSVLWAGDHPDALQVVADSTVNVVDGLDGRLGWQVLAGWIEIVIDLHVDLVKLLGDYEIARGGYKMAHIRYAVGRFRRDDGCPNVWQAVNDRVAEAKTESLRPCDVCGRAPRTPSCGA